MRILFVAGQFVVAGRYRCWAGLLPTARQVELASSLHALGHEPVLLAEDAVDLPDDIAALCRRQRPDAVIADHDTLPLPVRQSLAAVGLSVVWTSRSPCGTGVGPAGTAGAAGVVHEADLSGVLGALGLPAAVLVPPSATSVVVPPALRHRVGVELAHVGPEGLAGANDVGRVALSVQAAASVLSVEGGHSVALVGLELLDASQACRALDALVSRLATAVPLRARTRLDQLTPPNGAPLGSDGERDALCHLLASRLTTIEVDFGLAMPPDLDHLVATLGSHGAEVVFDAVFDEDLERVEALVENVNGPSGELRFTWDEAVSPVVLSQGEQLLAAAGNPTLGRQAGIGPHRSLMTLLTGRSDRPGQGAATRAVLLAPGAEAYDFAATGLHTDVFGRTPPRRSIGRFWPLDLEVDDGVPDLGARGELVLDGAFFETCHYAEGRHVTPYEPLLLKFTTGSDVRAFLADADTARVSGRFPAALVSPFAILADSCAWGEPGACSSEHLGRVVLEASGGVRLSPRGPVVGHATDPYDELVRLARRHLSKLHAERGCSSCRVAATCSKDACLSQLMDDETYCRERVKRPWLAAYLDAVEAVRAIRRDPADELPRLSGFGGLLFAELGERDPVDRPAVVLSTWKGSFYGFVPATGRAFRLTADTCLVAEALLTRGSGPPAEAVVRHRAISLSQATAATGAVAALLAERGAVIGPSAGGSAHPARAAVKDRVASR